ncbi:methanogenesis marker 2 protein [Pseudonocardia halophobica]|uniref:Methanogenesis marker 2 protein n=1 Tax=Pseudonocardia halophobica TaxID=29401 RepID=A0A9W6P197_9PSEU|nr:AIR synthase related protein [Pseudonocardia halophobica]GLL15940.1 methanogenesis marker 2 protein [Pseudonocardia halophobica]
MSAPASETLAELAAACLANPGLAAKAEIALVGEVLGGTDWQGGPGDDGAVVTAHGGPVVACGEALFPPFVAADPYGAGFAAVLTNVNDVAAMGGMPLGIVDTVVASEDLARKALAGMREAAELYDVPIVGGHLTLHEGDPAISAFAVGATAAPLSVTRAAPGQTLVVAAALDGRMREDFPFFPAFESRGRRSAGDVRLLGTLAGEGVVVAAKDISMAGLVGSLAMLLEPGRLGVTVDVAAVPAPAGVPLVRWFNCFPSFGFLLCVPAGREEECLAAFAERDLAAGVVGRLDDSGILALTRGDERVEVLDLHSTAVTGLPR